MTDITISKDARYKTSGSEAPARNMMSKPGSWLMNGSGWKQNSRCNTLHHCGVARSRLCRSPKRVSSGCTRARASRRRARAMEI